MQTKLKKNVKILLSYQKLIKKAIKKMAQFWMVKKNILLEEVFLDPLPSRSKNGSKFLEIIEIVNN